MKMLFRNLLLCAALVVPAIGMARHNPAVQPVFFDDLHQALPSSKPAPISVGNGVLFDVTWEGLAWAVQNVSTSHVPLIIEFYSSDPNECMQHNVNGVDECTPQFPEIWRTTIAYKGRVDVVRFNVQLHPQVLNGPDVQALPSHIFIADYTDSQHYTAIKVWGLLDQQGLEQTIQQTFNIAP